MEPWHPRASQEEKLRPSASWTGTVKRLGFFHPFLTAAIFAYKILRCAFSPPVCSGLSLRISALKPEHAVVGQQVAIVIVLRQYWLFNYATTPALDFIDTPSPVNVRNSEFLVQTHETPEASDH
jgi:hypothetical protein